MIREDGSGCLLQPKISLFPKIEISQLKQDNIQLAEVNQKQ